MLLRALEVDVAEPIQRLHDFLPDAASAHLGIRLPIALLAVTSVAVVEELVFRGALLGALLRCCRSRRVLTAGAVVVVALLWALMHALNTDAPLIKCSQIFVVGVLLCEIARRSCLEAAMAAHISLNVAAVLLGFALPAG